MGFFKTSGLSQDIAVASSPIITGVENGVPGNLIQDYEAQSMYNRLASIDGINRTRPGIMNLVNTGASPVLAVQYFGSGNYLVTDGQKIWSWNTATQTLTLKFSSLGMPGGSGNIYTFLANNVAYFNQGAGLFYWDGTNLNTVSMPVQSPNASFPVWHTQRIVYAATGTNNLVFGDIDASGGVGFNLPNFGPANNSTTVTVKLDNDISGAISGICPFNAGTLLAGTKSRLYAVYADPTLQVANFEKQTISRRIGVAEHATMQQVGNDVMFLSQTGNGFFSMSTLVGTNQIGLSDKTSRAISSDVQRINWNAISTSRSMVWQDLYICAVPIDGAALPNAIFVYSAALSAWQGVWTGSTTLTVPISSPALQISAMGINETAGPNLGLLAGAELLVGLSNGNLGLFTKPGDNVYQDSAIGGAATQITSQILSKAFSPLSLAHYYTEAAGTSLNQIFPYIVRFRFPSSIAQVTLDLFSDTNTLLNFATLVTTTEQLQLPANLPWNLDTPGSAYPSVNVQSVNTCQELAFRLTGHGDWRLQSIEFGSQLGPPKAAQ